MAEAQIGIFGTVRTDGPGGYVYFAVRWDEPSAEGSITVADPRPTAKRFSSYPEDRLAVWLLTGQQRSRPGLDQLRVTLENQSIDVPLVFSTSRLYRDCSSLMQFVGRNSTQEGIRIISVALSASGYDERDTPRNNPSTMNPAFPELI